MPTAILLDWDSTLVDSWNGIVAAYDFAFSRLGRAETISRERVIALSAKPHAEIFLEVFGADDAQAGAGLIYRYLAGNDLKGMAILPGSEALLIGLQKLGIPLAVVSNKQSAFLKQEIAHTGWSKYFVAYVGAGDAAYDKPHPAPLLYALKQMGLSPGPDIWMVGDMQSDMQAAHRAGVTAVLMETTAGLGLGLEGDMSAHPPHLRVRDAKGLLEVVSLPLPHGRGRET